MPRPPLFALRVAVLAALWLALAAGTLWLWLGWVGWGDWCWRALVAGVATAVAWAGFDWLRRRLGVGVPEDEP